MKAKKIVYLMVLFASLFVIAPVSNVIAGAGPEPPTGAIISDTKIWGVITMYCTPAVNDLVIVRVKRVVDCDVETEIYVDNAWTADCPVLGDTDAFSEWSLNNYTFFDISGTPYITKVKNLVQDINVGAGTNATTVEAQFGFWTPEP
jgi:hypothetical protein